MSRWILLVAGGDLQVPAVEAAHELGYKVLVTDRDPDCACASLADHFVEMDTYNHAGHMHLAEKWKFDAVFTAGADPVFTVASTAHYVGLHGLAIDTVQACHRKDNTRVTLKEAGVPQPEFRMMSAAYTYLPSGMDWDKLIVKSLYSSGSRGHTKMTAQEFFDSTFQQEAFHVAKKYSKGSSDILVEQLLKGQELSVETLWHDGHMIPLNAVLRWFTDDPHYAIEMGHQNPWLGSVEDYARVWQVMQLTGQAVGMGKAPGGHILKGDLILTDDGPKVLELTPRLSGGYDSAATSPLAHGVNYTKGALLLALGRPLNEAMPHFTPRWYRHAACIGVFGPKEGGVIKEINGLTKARARAHVHQRYGVGETLPPLTDCMARVAFCIGSDEHDSHARHSAKVAVSYIEVVCE